MPPRHHPRRSPKLPIRSQLIDGMGVNRPDVSWGGCLMGPLSRPRRSRAAGSGGFFGPPTLHRGPDESQYFADHRRRNPLYRNGFRCNYTFGTGTPKSKGPCGAPNPSGTCASKCKAESVPIPPPRIPFDVASLSWTARYARWQSEPERSKGFGSARAASPESKPRVERVGFAGARCLFFREVSQSRRSGRTPNADGSTLRVCTRSPAVW